MTLMKKGMHAYSHYRIVVIFTAITRSYDPRNITKENFYINIKQNFVIALLLCDKSSYKNSDMNEKASNAGYSFTCKSSFKTEQARYIYLLRTNH